MNDVEISDEILSFDPDTLQRLPVRKSAVLEKFRSNRRAAGIVRAMADRRLRAHPDRSPEQAATLWYQHMLRRMERYGWRKSPAQTPHDFVSRIQEPALKSKVARFTRAYESARYITNEAFLGVRPAKSYIYYVILSPVGAYYPEGMNPVKILVVDKYVRAVEGGVGGAKTGVNYAASLYAAEEAKHEGFTQVLWLDGRERKYIDEVGTMNIMMKIGDEVITPPLSGTILAGVTRDSVLTLMREWGLRVSERPVTIDEVAQAAHKGKLDEVWGTGTAAVISPVGELSYKGERIVINGGRIGPLTQKLYDAIVGIQYGTAPDTHGWTVPV